MLRRATSCPPRFHTHEIGARPAIQQEDGSPGHQPHHSNGCGAASPVARATLNLFHFNIRHGTVICNPVLEVSQWVNNRVYVIVWFHPVGLRTYDGQLGPLQAVHPERWHVTLAATGMLHADPPARALATLRLANQLLWNRLTDTITEPDGRVAIQLGRPPWPRSYNFGVRGTAESAFTVMATTSEGIFRHFGFPVREARPLHVSWN